MNTNPLTDMKPPVRRFADGGKPESADELMKRMAAKYGTTGAAQAATAQPVPQAIAAPVKQVAPSIGGAVDALKNRKQQIDKAVDGYAGGGIVSGGYKGHEERAADRQISGVTDPIIDAAGTVVDSFPYAAAQFVPALNVPLGGFAGLVHAAQGRPEQLPLDAASMIPGGKAVALAKGLKLVASKAAGLVGRSANALQAMDSAGAMGKNAYADGGKIAGPGTPTSDSIPAKVNETGEPIAVSTEERILSGAQDAFLEKIAQDLGFPSLDIMLETGTGKPVGPTIKVGQKAAATGMKPENPLVQAIQQPSPMALSASPIASNTAYQAGSVADPRAVNPLAARPQAEAPYQEAARNAPDQIQSTVDSLFPSVKRFANGGRMNSIASDEEIARNVAEREAQNAAQAATQRGFASAPSNNDPAQSLIGLPVQKRPAITQAILGDRSSPTATAAPSAAGQKTFGVDYAATQQPTGPANPQTTPSQAIAVNPLRNDNYRPTTSPLETSFTETGTKENAANPLTTINMNANNESLARANAIRQSMIDGDGTGPKVTMLGNSGLTDTQNLMDKWGREDGTASAINQAIANPKAAGAIASLASNQLGNETNRVGQQLTQQTNAEANAIRQQGQGIAADVTMRGQDIGAQDAAARLAGNPLANALTQTQTAAIQSGLDDKKAVAAMLSEIQDPKTTPERRQALTQAYRLAQGKDPASKFLVVPGGEYTDPENPLVKMRSPSQVFDTEARTMVQGGGQTQAPAIPPQAVAMLKNDPKLAADFDKKYGAGAAQRILGV